MLRALEILLGLACGCLGLLLSVGAVKGAVGFLEDLAAGKASPLEPLVALSGVLYASLVFLATWLLLRTPREPGAAQRWARWLAVSGTGITLLVLVAIAVANYRRFSEGVSSSEPKLVLSVIRTAEEGHFAEFGEYVAFPSFPSGPPGRTSTDRIEYPEGAKAIGMHLALEDFPDVSCRYAVAVGSANEDGQPQAFTAEAICDADAGGVLMAWGYVRPDRESSRVIPGPFGRCPSEGALDPSTGRPTPNVVGPCDEASAPAIF